MIEPDNIYCGDCLELMKKMPDNFVDTIITDPPAGIGFMGKEWDSDRGGRDQWIEWLAGIMQEGLRVLKPGGMTLVWALPRTSHWTATAVENAGFEIRDIIMHIFGNGFPKSLDISKAIDKAAGVKRERMGRKESAKDCPRSDGWERPHHLDPNSDSKYITAPATESARLRDGWGTALKPACEHWIMAMKPIEGTFVENALKWGVAGLNIDGGRIKTIENCARKRSEVLNTSTPFCKGIKMGGNGSAFGRFPSHLIHDGSDEVMGKFPVTKSGDILKCHQMTGGISPIGTFKIRNRTGEKEFFGSTGSAARFFYCAKANRSERDKVKNNHPTVKSLALMTYLCNFTKTPMDGIVLDPFMGSGTTIIAAIRTGRKYIGMEIDQAYFAIAQKRIALENQQMKLELK